MRQRAASAHATILRIPVHNNMDAAVAPGRPDLIAAGVIFLVALLVFWFSPVSQVTDSHYSLLLSESLLKHRSFVLDHYSLPRLEGQAGIRDDYVANGHIWQLEQVDDHLYYYFPPGSSILSLPYVGIANLFGFSPVNPDGSYNPDAEVRLETGLAALLMAAFGAILFFTARSMLPLGWSAAVAVTTLLGTQVWSTTSRALWSQTWEVLLIGLVALVLVRHACGRHRIRPVLFATLVAWTYFVRPSGFIVVLAVTIYVALRERRILRTYLLTGCCWLALFVIYSQSLFRQNLPSYYKPSRLRLDLFPTALAGNLISPSRGLFVYVPVVLFVLYLLIKYRYYLEPKILVTLSLGVMVAHTLLVSSFANRLGDWWGGASYGPRYLADLVPWLALLAIIGLRAMLRWRDQHAPILRLKSKVPLVAGAVLAIMSVVINARGALSLETWRWTQPVNDKQMRALLWDWQHPQFLAGWQEPAPPVDVLRLVPGTRVDFTSADLDQYLWYGWSGAEPQFRWTDGKQAALIFDLDQIQDSNLRFFLGPFIAGSSPANQQLAVMLNKHPIASLQLEGSGMRELSLTLPRQYLAKRNALVLSLPNATKPASVSPSEDQRLLGIRVAWMELSAIQ